jgi:hypothetical protein
MTFHFYPWDDKYGPPPTDREIFAEQQALDYVRTSIYDIVAKNATGIDGTARIVADQYVHHCLYCTKKFRNQYACKMHMEDHHVPRESLQTNPPPRKALPRANPPSVSGPSTTRLFSFYIVFRNKVLSDELLQPLSFASRKEARETINKKILPDAEIVANIAGIDGRYNPKAESNKRAKAAQRKKMRSRGRLFANDH